MNKNWKTQFIIIWLGQAISILTSSILQMALIWHLSLQTASAAILSLASIAGFLPTAVLGLFAGALVDRWNRKLTMIGADLFIALVSLTLAIYAIFAELPVWLVLLVLFVRSIGTAFHSPSLSAVTPLLVPEDKLTKCAGYTQSLQSIGYMAGTAIAALIYPVWSIGGLILLDVLGAILACVTTAFIKIPAPPAQAASEDHGLHLITEMKEGYLAVQAHRGIFVLLWIGAAFMFLYSPINALFPLMSLNYFGGTTTAASISEIAFSIGMLLGGIVLGLWGGLKNRAYTIAGAIAIMGTAICFSGLLPDNGFWIFALFCVMMGLSVPFYSAPQVALMQEKLEPQYLGRAFGLYGSIMSLAMPLGLILSGLFADRIGINYWFVLCGAASVLLSLLTISIKSVREIEG
ncbi:MAG: transporter [Herbinix sp.]|jgi:DHA3 family macrolide efflux protein-like MFS transporter|nr:transporter [Herbinix sp.]